MMSLHRSGGPSWDGVIYYRNDLTNDPRAILPYPTTITNLGGILSIDPLPTYSQILPNTFNPRSTNAPATYVHEHEIEIARWQARKRVRRGQPECPFTCSVCLEPMEPSVWVRPTALCVHEPRICEPCLGQYVMHDVQEGLTEVLCPDVECRHQMDHRDVVGYIRGDPVCLNRYNTLVAQRKLESQPNFVWCQNPRCGRGQIHHRGDASPLVICHYCRSPSCFTHRVAWHNGLTCEDYNIRILHEGEMQASEDYIGRHTKQCPQCRRPIEKITGCDHMTCLRPGGCGHEFCWLCLADYGNHRHYPDCMYYAGSSASEETSIEETRFARFYRSPTPIPARDIDTWSESIQDLPESPRYAQFESPPVPMPLRLRDSWEDLTTLESDRPSYVEAWQPATPPISHETDRWEDELQAQRPSYSETWWPLTPPLPHAAEGWDGDRRYGRVW